MVNLAPGYRGSSTAFREKTVNVGIPFKITSKSVKDTDKTRGKTRGKTLRFIDLEKHTGDYTVDG